MKKIVLFSLFILLHCHLTFSMLTKKICGTTKYIKNLHSKKINLIQDLLKNNPIKDPINDNEDDLDYLFSANYNDYQDTMSEYEQDLKDLYFRDENIIEILREDIKDIQKKRTQEIKEMRKKISTLKKQQNLAVLGLAGNTGRIHEIEKELHTTFNIPKDTE